MVILMQNDPAQMKRQVLSVLAIAAGASLIIAVLIITRYLVLGVLIGIGFGALMSPISRLLKKRFKVPRSLSALTLIILVLGGMGAIGYGFYVLLADQVQMLSRQGPEIIMRVQNYISSVVQDFPWIKEQIGNFNLSQAARATVTTVSQGLQTGVGVLAGLVLVLTLATFTAIGADRYFDGFLSLFPAYLRPHAGEVLQKTGTVLRRWFGSQLIVMSISGVVTTLALWILDIDYFLLLGVLTGLLGFIPYIGAFLTVFATALVTLGSDPEKIWWVLGIYFGIQQLEGNVTIPLVMRSGAHLPEVHVIVFMLIMGSLFGLLGVFAAPPLLAVLRNIYLMTYVPMMDGKVEPPSKANDDEPEESTLVLPTE